MIILEREAKLAKLAGFTIDEIGRYCRPDGVACPHGRPPHFLSDLNAAFCYILPIIESPRQRGLALSMWAYTLAECARRGNHTSSVSAASLLCDAVEEMLTRQHTSEEVK